MNSNPLLLRTIQIKPIILVDFIFYVGYISRQLNKRNFLSREVEGVAL